MAWGPPTTAEEQTTQPPTAVADASGSWGPPVGGKDETPTKPDTSGPMPGPIDALVQGFKHAVGTSGQTAEALQGKQPAQLPPDTSPAASNYEWRDLKEPTRGLSKLTYQLGASSPTLAAGVLGGAAGSLVAPGLGTAIGGIGGAAAGAALQTLGPVFSQELQKHPNDPEGAWSRAMQSAAVSGAFSGASWGAFPLKFFNGPVKNLAFQAFGVQPGIGVAEKATHNVIAGDPVSQDLGSAYVQGAVGTVVPALGHVALRGRFGEPETRNPEPTAAELVASANERMARAGNLINQSMAPNVSPSMAKRFIAEAGDLHDAAAHDLDRQNAPAREQAKRQQADQLDQQAQSPGTAPIQADTLRAQARELRREADHDGFIAKMAPPLAKPSKTMWGKVKNSYIENVQPEMTSDWALRAESLFGMFKSRQAHGRDSVIHESEKLFYKFNKLSEPEKYQFMHEMEMPGGQFPSSLAPKYSWITDAATKFREQMDADYRLEAKMGSRASFLQDYFPHFWKDVGRAREFFDPVRMASSMGETTFQKHRVYDLIEMGRANGLELVSNNPAELVRMRRMASVDMVNKMELLHGMERQGVAVPTDRAPPQVTNPKINGGLMWEQKTAPTGEKWMVAPDVKALWENAVVAKGLWAHEGMTGDAFRSWMKLKSAWVPIKLGLSLFHPVHVAHINFVNNMSRALGETFGSGQQGLARRFAAMPEALLQSVADTFFRAPPFGASFVGKRMRQSHLTTHENQTPQQRADNELMSRAGISAQLSEQLKIAAKKDLHEAIAQNKYLSAVPAVGRRLMEFVSGPIFEEWIPNLKVAALKRESETLFRRRPDLLANDEAQRIALRTIGKQIDNRFGEMFYGSLFWNRTLKDASIGSFLSLGWNLGFIREFGGGAFEPIVRRLIDTPTPTRKLIRDVSNKSTNMILYTITAMAINAAMTKMMSGDNPQGLDYIFPRIGGLNPDGSPRRITNAFYTREVPMAFKNIEERQSVASGLAQMMYHKMMFAPFAEMAHNKDYFGNQIMDENAPAFKQAWQFGKHLLTEQLNPMSISGAQRSLLLSGKPHGWQDVFKQMNDFDSYGSFLGFGPAPAYASKSPLDNRIQYLFRKNVAPESRSFETAANAKEKSEWRTIYRGAMQRGDETQKLEAAKELAKLGVKTREIAKLKPGQPTQYMFQRLPRLDQIALFRQMSPEEFRNYYMSASKSVKQDPEVAGYATKYFQQQP